MDASTAARCVVAAAPVPGGLVADPFCGVGTTLSVCTARGLRAIGLESLSLFAGAARAKLTELRDTAAMRQAARQVIDGIQAASIDSEHDLVRRCFPRDALGQLVAIRNRLACHAGPWSDHLRLAVIAILRDHACVQVGWPHPQPDRPRTPRSIDPVSAFIQRVDAIAHELDAHPAGWSTLGRVERRDARGSLAWSGLARPASVDAVITSPPYFTGFDYPDAMRLESLFAAPQDLSAIRRSRDFQLAASAHHASIRRSIEAHRELGEWPRTQGASRALSGALRNRRLSGGSRKPYDQVLPMYLRDLARTFATLTPLLRPGAAVVVVVANSAPAGVLVPVPRLIERLGPEIGLQVEGSQIVRERGRRWAVVPDRPHTELTEELLLLRRPTRLRKALPADNALAPAPAALALAQPHARTRRAPHRAPA
jgi:hypothetical protein